MSDKEIIDEVLAEDSAERKTFADQIKNPPRIPAKFRPAVVHNLKINRAPYDDLVFGVKTCEVRDCSDRDFQVGDSVELFMTETESGRATESIVRKISHIQRGYGLPDGICVLSYESDLRQQLADVSNERDIAQRHLERMIEAHDELQVKLNASEVRSAELMNLLTQASMIGGLTPLWHKKVEALSQSAPATERKPSVQYWAGIPGGASVALMSDGSTLASKEGISWTLATDEQGAGV